MNSRIAAVVATLLLGLAGCTKTVEPSRCAVGETLCGTTCVDTQASALNCGACGASCAPGQVCAAGACQATCPAGATPCDGGCVELSSARGHCGACGHACGQGEFCVDGACTALCEPPLKVCGTACRDPRVDVENCGDCGVACAVGKACVAGQCEESCPAGERLCDGACRDTATDRQHCGSCGHGCAADELCNAGVCELHCAAGLEKCDGACRDLLADREACGSCGGTCGLNEQCVTGTCTLTCEGATPDACDGACTNVLADPAHCGTCAHACATSEVCDQGTCKGSCPAPLTACSGACVALSDSVANCGACGHACTAPANAAPACVAGACTTLCLAGYGDCDAAADGCETRLTTDVRHCGACEVACPAPAHAAASCSGGACGLGACAPGWGNCDGDASNGCETDLATSAAHCGACNHACAAPVTCGYGVCGGVATGDCSVDVPAIASASPAFDSTTASVRVNPSFTSTLKLHADSGAITLTGARGTLTFALPNSAVVFSNGDKTVTITPGAPFASGETVTVGWPGVTDVDCGKALSSRAWSFTVPDCSATSAQLSALEPAAGGTIHGLQTAIRFTSDLPMVPGAGSFTITGSLGTARTITVPNSAVTFSNGNRTVSIDPGVEFKPGEQVTVSWSNLIDATCEKPVTAPAWTFGVVAPDCTGAIPPTATRLASGLTSTMAAYYLAADSDPAGYVYVGADGGGTNYGQRLYRIPKAGGAPLDLYAAAGLADTNLGFGGFLNGNDFYALASETGKPIELVTKISSSDGGTTWTKADAVEFVSPPNASLYSGAAYGGSLFVMTRQTTATGMTEIWQASASPSALPAVGRLVKSFGGKYFNCVGLAVDTANLYAACRLTDLTAYAIVRLARARDEVTELYRYANGNTTTMALQGVDTDHDGAFDYLYVESKPGEVHVVCRAAGSSYYGHKHYVWAAAVGFMNAVSRGIAYDSAANALWLLNGFGTAAADRTFVKVADYAPAPGEAWVRPLPLTASGPVTPSSTKRLDAPSCMTSGNVTWYSYTRALTGLQVLGDGNAALALFDAAGTEIRCIADAREGIGNVAAAGAVSYIAVPSGTTITALTLNEFTYTGVGASTSLVYAFSAAPGSVFGMASNATHLFYNVGANSVASMPKAGGAPISKGSADGITTAQLAFDLVEANGSIFSIDNVTTNTPGRLWKLHDGTTWLNPPQRWDVDGSTFPATALNAMTFDGTDLIIAGGGTTSAAPVAFYAVTAAAPQIPRVLGTATRVYNARGIAADANYFYVYGQEATDQSGVYRFTKSNLATPPVKLLATTTYSASNVYALKLDSLTNPEHLYARLYGPGSLIHVIRNPASTAAMYLGTLPTPVGTTMDYGGMTYDFAEHALYFFEDQTASTGFIRKIQ